MASIEMNNVPVAHKLATSSSLGGFGGESAFTAAYERRLSEICAVPDGELLPVNLDVQGAVATVLGTLPEIRALRSELVRLPQLDGSVVDALEDYAMAAGEASSLYATATAPQEDIVALNEEASELRELLRSDATALANRGLIDRARLASFKGLVGYKNVAFELIDWANLIQDCWSRIEGKTALSAAELVRAKQVGERLVRAAGLREQGPATVVEAARRRQQAFTLLMKAYDEVRRGVAFLRWRERDAEQVAPSLYSGKARSRRSDVETFTEATPGAPLASASPSTPAPPPVHAPVAPGLPGASPFTAG
jgi:hypothetical protein